MKRFGKLQVCAGLISGTALLSGCASTYPQGALLQELKVPMAVTTNIGKSSKKGVSECKSYLSMIAIGDASIDAAKKQGGITEVHHVDWEVKNVLGLIGEYKCIVYGD